MTDPGETEMRQRRSRRIRRVKWWLRPLPRRANIRRYPVLRYFADATRKRAYIWSFRVEHAVPAIYAGCILTLLPLYGIQLPLAFLLALWLRANLPILAGLQLASNPITVLPMWYIAYRIGRNCLAVFGIDAMPLRRNEVRIMLDNFILGEWGSNLDRLSTVFGVTSLGGLMMGTFFGVICAFLYRIAAKRTAAGYAKFSAKRRTKPEENES